MIYYDRVIFYFIEIKKWRKQNNYIKDKEKKKEYILKNR